MNYVRNTEHSSEPLMPTCLPDCPWQKVGMDLFEWSKRDYLLIIDYFTRYIEIAELKNTSAEVTTRAIKEVFARQGSAEVVISDNGPQFASAVFNEFAKENNFMHITSSPCYPQANGELYGPSRTCRKKTRVHGFSPAQLLMGRNLRTCVVLLVFINFNSF